MSENPVSAIPAFGRQEGDPDLPVELESPVELNRREGRALAQLLLAQFREALGLHAKVAQG
jgi:hypothetical protein